MFGYVFYQMLVALYLGSEVSPYGRNYYLGPYLFQNLKNVIALLIVFKKLLVAFKSPSGSIIGAVGIKIRAKFPIKGIAYKTACT